VTYAINISQHHHHQQHWQIEVTTSKRRPHQHRASRY